MAVITLRFCNLNWPIISKIIQLFNKSWTDHVDIIIDDYIYSAIPDKVIKVKKNNFPIKYTKLINIECSQEQKK